MKSISRIISLFLGATLVVSATGCKKNETQKADAPRVTLEKYVGTHDYTAPDTEDYLVRNGICNYKVVIPENASETIISAKDEFICLFQKATGIRLVTIKDTNLSHNERNTYISIGETALLSSAQIDVDKDALGRDGCRVVTKDKTVYIVGGSDYGSLFSVYTFMEVTFGYDTYYKDCIEIETDVKNKALKAYNVTDIPDFEHRAWHSINVTWDLEDYDESMFPTRLRYMGYRRTSMFGVVNPATNQLVTAPGVMTYLPQSKFDDALVSPDTYHPKWYSTEGEELCYNARGDEDERKAMIDTCVDVIIESLKVQTPEAYPDKYFFSFFQCDNLDYCRCETCLEQYDYYGTMSGIYLNYINDLAAAVEEELKDEKHAAYKRDNLLFEIYAYSYSTTAPAKYNASTGKWESLVDLRDDIIIEYAPTYEYQTAFTAEVNDNERSNFDAWEAVLGGKNKMNYYLYDTNYGNKCFMLDSFDYYTAETFSHYASKSNLGIYFDSAYSETSTTAWNNLKQYLKAKLCWNTSLDTGKLIDKYFNAMYKEAAPMMKAFFMNQRMYWQEILIGEYGTNGTTRPSLSNLEYWPLPMLQNWVSMCDQAKIAVSRYKTSDAMLYQDICTRIEVEAIAVLYMIMDMHINFISEQTKAEYINRLVYDVNELDLSGTWWLFDGTFGDWVSTLQ